MDTSPRPIDGNPHTPSEPSPAARGPMLLRGALVAFGTLLLIVSSTFLLGGGGALGGPNLGESASAQALVPSDPSFQTFGFLAGNPELPRMGQVPVTTAAADSVNSPAAPLSTDRELASGDDAAPDGSGSAPAAVAPTGRGESDADEPPPASASGIEGVEPTASPTPAPRPSAPPPLPPQGEPAVVAPAPTATPPPPTPTAAPPTATPPPPPPPPAAPPAPSISLLPLESGLLAAINTERVAAGLAALQADPTLVTIARIRSDDMMQRGYFDHYSPDGTSVFDILAQYGVPYAHAGENLAYDTYPADQAVAVTIRQLMASPSHRANILNVHYTMIGVGLATTSDGGHYFTMVFVGL